MAIKIKVYSNSDHTNVVWATDKEIANCLGFALIREVDGKQQQTVDTFVGPENGPKVADGTKRPSTDWPIQKFMWSDYLAPAGSKLRYKVVPRIGTSFSNMTDGTASSWSGSVSLTPDPKAKIRACFNRGVVSTQWTARQLKAAKGKSLKSLVSPPLGKTTPVRDFLGGDLKKTLLDTLAKQQASGAHIYASLFELSDPEIIPAILKFGQHAHVILANGTHAAPKKEGGKKAAAAPKKKKKAAKTTKKGKLFDENADARKLLREGHVELHDRMVNGDHFSHHKFIVFTDPKNTTKGVSVWTGSTNLTVGGLCTQANNGILIQNPVISARYLAQWRELVKDVDKYPDTLLKLGDKPMSATDGSGKITAWFAPNNRIGAAPKKGTGNKYGKHPDMLAARKLIQEAEEGILFLVFNPGYQDTLLNDILDLLKKPLNKQPYVHGVANQDPTGGKEKKPLIFVHRNKKERAPLDIVLPAAVNSYASMSKKDKQAAVAMNKWVKMVNNYWQQEPTGMGIVRVHSKCIVVDPFGKHPVVMTGSHNLGPKASAMNDDNLVIIENEPDIAEQYAVNIMTVYNQYRWRFQQLMAAKNRQPLNEWHGLQAPWKGQASWITGDNARELKFWT